MLSSSSAARAARSSSRWLPGNRRRWHFASSGGIQGLTVRAACNHALFGNSNAGSSLVRLGRWLIASRPAREAYALAFASARPWRRSARYWGWCSTRLSTRDILPAVVLSALVGGWGPGLLAGSALISSLLLPAGSWAALGLNDVINLIVFVRVRIHHRGAWGSCDACG